MKACNDDFALLIFIQLDVIEFCSHLKLVFSFKQLELHQNRH